MTRKDIDVIFDQQNNGPRGQSVGGQAQQTPRPSGIIQPGMVQPSPDAIADIVNEMSTDKTWMKDVYEDEYGELPNRPRIDGLPTEAPHPFRSDTDEFGYPLDGDTLYNEPWRRGLDDYFAKAGFEEWFNNLGLSTRDENIFREYMNIREAQNNYQREQNLNDMKYGQFLNDLAREQEEAPRSFDFDRSEYIRRPRARQRYFE